MASPDNKTTRMKGKKTSGLNKPVILGLGVFCLIMVIWAIIQGLSSGTHGQKQRVVAVSNGNDVAPGKALKELPDNYNSSKMRFFRHSVAPETVTSSQIDTLKNKLASLESDYQQLQNRLYKLQQPKSKPVENKANGMTQIEKKQAMQSPILVPVATSLATTSLTTTASKNKKDMKAGKNTGSNVETAKVEYPKSQNEIMAGSSIPAVLQTEVVSDVPGTVVGIVRQNVYDSLHGNNILIPKGTRLIGSYQSNVLYGQNSLQIAFTRLIRPDGSSIDLSKFPGTSPLGISGMGEEVNNHWGAIFGSALLSSVFSIPAILASNNQYASSCVTNSTGTVCNNNTVNQTRNAALQSMGQTASEVGSQVAGRALSIRPTVLIHPGYTFSVLVTKDLVLPPYHGS